MSAPDTYARYKRWLAARDLHLVRVTGPDVSVPFGPWMALAERANGSYGYGHGYTPREAVISLCRTIRAHEQAQKTRPNVFWTYRGG
jgi:hypothetical protein